MTRPKGGLSESGKNRAKAIYEFIREYEPVRRTTICAAFPQWNNTEIQRTLEYLIAGDKVNKNYIIPVRRYKSGGRKPDVYYSTL